MTTRHTRLRHTLLLVISSSLAGLIITAIVFFVALPYGIIEPPEFTVQMGALEFTTLVRCIPLQGPNGEVRPAWPCRQTKQFIAHPTLQSRIYEIWFITRDSGANRAIKSSRTFYIGLPK
jgi:hypothetical protein